MSRASQAELAIATGLQPSAISHFETKTRRPSFDNLRRLADALKVSIDYLLGRSDAIGVAAQTDILYRNIERLSASDRELADKLVAQMVARNTKGESGGSGS